jgi:probable HAF family extracellular repeat protein
MLPGVHSPLLWVLLGPARLLLPAELWANLDQDRRAALLAHELAHLRRGDHWVRLLEQVATVFYWWNPVVWWTRRALHRAEEQCCDAWVVWALPGQARAYADALLDTLDFLALAPRASAQRPILGGSGLGDLADLKSRLARILRNPAPRSLSWAGSIGLLGLAGVVLPLAPLARLYTVTDLGTLGGDWSWARKINNRGQVLGIAETRDGAARPYLTGSNQPSDRLTNVLNVLDRDRVEVSDVDDAGRVVAMIDSWHTHGLGALTFDPPARTILVDRGEVRELRGPRSLERRSPEGIPIENGRPTRADPKIAVPEFMTIDVDAIGANGEIVGTIRSGDSYGRGFRALLDRPINLTTDELGDLRGSTPWQPFFVVCPCGINAHGEVAGTAPTIDAAFHAFRTRPGARVNVGTDDLGTLGGRGSTALGINDRGQIVGFSSLQGERGNHAFRTAPRAMIDPTTDDLGTLGGNSSMARAINADGIVVGNSGIAGQSLLPRFDVGGLEYAGGEHAFLHDGRRMRDLNGLIPPWSTWLLFQANDINDRGQIVGTGLNPAGHVRACRLDPIGELATFALLVLGTGISGSAFALRRVLGGI